MVPFCPFYFRVPLLKPNSKKKGTLTVMGLLRNLVMDVFRFERGQGIGYVLNAS